METQDLKKERIDIRVTPEEKRVFLQARKLSGDRSLSSFITRVVKMRAMEIIKDNEKILASKKDKDLFFEAVFAEMEPNQALKDAAKKYKSL